MATVFLSFAFFMLIFTYSEIHSYMNFSIIFELKKSYSLQRFDVQVYFLVVLFF